MRYNSGKKRKSNNSDNFTVKKCISFNISFILFIFNKVRAVLSTIDHLINLLLSVTYEFVRYKSLFNYRPMNII